MSNFEYSPETDTEGVGDLQSPWKHNSAASPRNSPLFEEEIFRFSHPFILFFFEDRTPRGTNNKLDVPVTIILPEALFDTEHGGNWPIKMH